MSQAKETASLVMIKTVMLTSVPVMKLRLLLTMTCAVLVAMTSIQYTLGLKKPTRYALS